MSVYKRGKRYWMDVVVDGARHREPLETTNWQEHAVFPLHASSPSPTARLAIGERRHAKRSTVLSMHTLINENYIRQKNLQDRLGTKSGSAKVFWGNPIATDNGRDGRVVPKKAQGGWRLWSHG